MSAATRSPLRRRRFAHSLWAMGKQFAGITDKLRAFIEAQHVFFVATAARDGPVNVSPKGLDSLRVLGPDRVVWVDAVGSGNKTAAHLLDTPRMTLMFCSFDVKPQILRLYGTAVRCTRTETKAGPSCWISSLTSWGPATFSMSPSRWPRRRAGSGCR